MALQLMKFSIPAGADPILIETPIVLERLQFTSNSTTTVTT